MPPPWRDSVILKFTDAITVFEHGEFSMKRPSQTASWLAAISIISVPLMGDITSAKPSQKIKNNQDISVSRSSNRTLIAFSRYAIDLSKPAVSGSLDQISTFDKEVDRALRILGSHDHSNPVLVSESGVNLNRMRLAQG
ncbi:MAG: hypothetical protein QOH96_3835 [Blastocatellia bacterium]|jgi:ATP-dependent Clp protease ATP-binding subunit ClpA|nr:hypothetical protein [Blastocatellia bacterium]